MRKENTEMRGLLKQNEIIINKNIDSLKSERALNERLLEALESHLGPGVNLEDFVRGLE